MGETIQEVVHRNIRSRLGGRSIRSVQISTGMRGSFERYFRAPVDVSLTTLDRLASLLRTTPAHLVDPAMKPRHRPVDKHGVNSTDRVFHHARDNLFRIRDIADRKVRHHVYEASSFHRRKTFRLSFLALLCEHTKTTPRRVLG